MKAEINEKIAIPEGITVEVNGTLVKVTGEKGTLEREMKYPGVTITNTDGNVILNTPKGTLREKRMIKTFGSHLKNMMTGAKEGYTYELKICSGHFPMTVAVEGNQVKIKNFLGEKVPRTSEILEGVQVKVDGEKVICEGTDKEKVGQTAARIERSTVIKGRDRRIFQDGVYITSKAGRALL